jgi:hypothetical protein
MVQYEHHAGDEPPPSTFDIIPPRWYAATIEDIIQKDTKSGDGWYFNFKFRVDENRHPEVGGRILFSILNVGNANPEAVKIANADMDRIMHGTGLLSMKDTDQLLGRSLAIRVVVTPPKNGYEEKNEVKGYDSIAARVDNPQPSQSTAQRATGTPPSQGNASGSAAHGGTTRSWRKS